MAPSSITITGERLLAPDEPTPSSRAKQDFESADIPANPRGTATFYDGGDRITIIGGTAFVSRASCRKVQAR
jgi:hypothetical protein